MAIAYVRGLQGNDSTYIKVGATCKHFAAYSLEEAEGVSRFAFDAQISARDAAETYMPAFEACVREARASSVMCSYNAVNGTPACASRDLLDGTLRGRWGFDGFVVSDCGAIDSVFWPHRFAKTRAEAGAVSLKAGTDMSCIDYSMLRDALRDGLIEEADLDTAVERLLTARFRLGMFDPPSMVPFSAIPISVVGSPAHRAKARQAAQRGIVLLKNAGSPPLLPLQKSALKRVVVIGPHANTSEYLLGNYYGKVAGDVPTPLAAIKEALGPDVNVDHLWGARVEGWSADGVDESARACTGADVCIFCLGLTTLNQYSAADPAGRFSMWSPVLENEMHDRRTLRLPGFQEDIVLATARLTDTPIVVVLFHGGPLDVQVFDENERVGAMLSAWYPGQGAQAVADVLFGDVSPSGRLPVTFYYDNYTSQVSATSMNMRSFPGRTYRYVQVPILYPFGHGLSYTRFQYHDLRTEQVRGRGDFCDHVVTLVVKNTGPVESEHVVLLFLTALEHPKSHWWQKAGKAHELAARTLKGFQRVHLSSGASTLVKFSLTCRDFELHNDEKGTTEVRAGTWKLQVGELENSLAVKNNSAKESSKNRKGRSFNVLE